MYRSLSLGQAETTPPPIIDVWGALDALCKKSLSPSECASLIGTHPVYIPESECIKTGLPWWAYLAIGFLVAKNI